MEKFPQNVGLPYIPSKYVFGRSQTHEVAEQRLPELVMFVSELLAMPAHISLCREVVDFFTESEKDASGVEQEDNVKRRPNIEIMTSL